MMALMRPMNQKKQLCIWSMSAMLVVALVAALALSSDAQAQVVPWTRSDLNGNARAVSGASLADGVYSVSTEGITFADTNTATNIAQPMEFRLIVAVSSDIASTSDTSSDISIMPNLRVAVWNDALTFSSGGIGTVSADISLRDSQIELVEENYAFADDGSAVNIYEIISNEATLGTVQYNSLIDTVTNNPDNNVFSFYGDGDSVLTITGTNVEGDTLIYRNPQGDFFELAPGLATQGRIVTSDSEPAFELGDVNQDGAVSFSDIGPFITVLASGEFQAEADCDENGMVTFADIGPFIGILSSQ